MIPLPPWAYGAAVVVTFTAGFGTAWKVQDWRHKAEQLAALESAQRAFNDALAKQQSISAEYEADTATAREVAYDRQTTIRTYYRDVPVPGDCAVPADVAGMLAQAVDDANARASGQPSGTVPPASPTAAPAD